MNVIYLSSLLDGASKDKATDAAETVDSDLRHLGQEGLGAARIYDNLHIQNKH